MAVISTIRRRVIGMAKNKSDLDLFRRRSPFILLGVNLKQLKPWSLL